MKRIRCIRKNCQNEAEIHPVYGVIPCSTCRDEDSEFGTQSRYLSVAQLHRIQKQRDEHGKDLIQPFSKGKINQEFAEAFPEKADDYYTKEELQKL